MKPGQQSFPVVRPALPALERMSRDSDPATSHEAAAAVAPHLSDLQRLVLAAFVREGPMTAVRAERFPEFAGLAPSTCRKRIVELHRAGHLVQVGIDRSGRCAATIFQAAERSES